MAEKILAAIALMTVLGVPAAEAAWNVGGSFGTLSTGEAIGRGEVSILAGLGVGDATTAFGSLRYGVGDRIDGRIKLGLRDEGGTDAELIFGADLMFQVLTREVRGGDPLNLSFGGMTEVWNSEAYDIWQIGGFTVGSYPFRLGNGMGLSPYGRLNVRVEDISDDAVRGDSSELELGFNGGARLDVTRSLQVYAEFQIDGNDGLFLGAEFLVH